MGLWLGFGLKARTRVRARDRVQLRVRVSGSGGHGARDGEALLVIDADRSGVLRAGEPGTYMGMGMGMYTDTGLQPR